MRETLDLLQGLALTRPWEWVGHPCQGVVLTCVGLKSMEPARGRELYVERRRAMAHWGPKAELAPKGVSPDSQAPSFHVDLHNW